MKAMPKLYKFKFSVVECITQQTVSCFVFEESSFFDALEKARSFAQDNEHEVHYCGASANE